MPHKGHKKRGLSGLSKALLSLTEQMKALQTVDEKTEFVPFAAPLEITDDQERAELFNLRDNLGCEVGQLIARQKTINLNLHCLDRHPTLAPAVKELFEQAAHLNKRLFMGMANFCPITYLRVDLKEIKMFMTIPGYCRPKPQ